MSKLLFLSFGSPNTQHTKANDFLQQFFAHDKYFFHAKKTRNLAEHLDSNNCPKNVGK